MAGWIYIALRLFVGVAFAEGGHGAEGAAAGAPAEGGHGGGHDEHGGIPTEALIFTVINLTLFVGAMFWLAGRPVGDLLKNRALTVRAGLDEAAKLQQEAQQRFSDVEAKLVALGRQVEDLKADARVEADREAQVLQQRADAEAVRLKETAERTIREETQRATTTIRGEAAELAIQLAREMLKQEASVEDQQRLATQFLAAVRKEAPHG